MDRRVEHPPKEPVFLDVASFMHELDLLRQDILDIKDQLRNLKLEETKPGKDDR